MSTQLFPSLLNLSCASGSEMEWISSGGGDVDPLRKKQSERKKVRGLRRRGRRSFLLFFPSFFPILFCASVSMAADRVRVPSDRD